MNTHEMEWTFDVGLLRGRVICNATPDADCHLVGATGCECEEWVIEHDPDGTPFHMAYAGGDPEYVRHEMTRSDLCNFRAWLDNSDEVEEMFIGSFVIGRTAIEPVWCGDYCEWKPAEVSA